MNPTCTNHFIPFHRLASPSLDSGDCSESLSKRHAGITSHSLLLLPPLLLPPPLAPFIVLSGSAKHLSCPSCSFSAIRFASILPFFLLLLATTRSALTSFSFPFGGSTWLAKNLCNSSLDSSNRRLSLQSTTHTNTPASSPSVAYVSHKGRN